MAVTQRLYAAIGRVAAECSEVENQLRYIFVDLIADGIGLILTNGEDLSRITKMCRQVAPYSDALRDADAPRLYELLQRADQLRDLRNLVVHAQWLPSLPGRPGMHLATRSRRAKAPTTPRSPRDRSDREWDGGVMSVDDVRQVGDAFVELRKAIEAFEDKAFPRPRPALPLPRGWFPLDHKGDRH